MAKQFNVPFIETSAKTRLRIEDPFFECVRLIRKKDAANSKNAGAGASTPKRRGCTIL